MVDSLCVVAAGSYMRNEKVEDTEIMFGTLKCLKVITLNADDDILHTIATHASGIIITKSTSLLKVSI